MGVYNEQAYVDVAIESVLSQTYEDFEFIIVDDASTDGSKSRIQAYDDDRIALLENEDNIGLTASLKRAIAHANGRYIARQDADDISESTRFERQVAVLDSHSEVAVVGTGAKLIDGKANPIDQRIPRCNPQFEDFLKKSHLIHGSTLIRRAPLEAVGGYNTFFRYSQDLDLWLRLARNHEIVNVSDPLYRHRIHDGGVYFSRKDESALYGYVARDLATGRIDEQLMSDLAADGITTYYEHLEPVRRVAFHCDLATRYLRYGHCEPARKECRKARSYDRFARRPLLLLGLSYSGERGIEAVRTGLRRYLNLKVRVRNRTCPYYP